MLFRSQQNEKEEQEGRDDQGGGGEDREVVGIEVGYSENICC